MKTTLLSLRSSYFIGRLRPFISRAAAFIARSATCLVRAGFKPAPYRRTAVRLVRAGLKPAPYCLLLLLLATFPAFAQMTVCANQGFMLTSKTDAQSISGGVTYTWYVSKDNGAPASITNSNAAFISIPEGRPAGTYAYVRMVASAECQDGVPANTFTVVVKPCTPTYAASTQTWVVTGQGGAQTWSDVINVTDCNKEEYDGTKSDCRNNGSYGYLYSWHYVDANANTLCPSSSGWRVPSKEDFCNLDKNLNSSTSCTNNRSGVYGSTYNGTSWGGSYGGFSDYQGTLHDQGSLALYWSSESKGDEYAFELYYTSEGVYPWDATGVAAGLPVRCVK